MSPSKFTVAGRSLLLDGAPFEVRGVAYSPLLSYAERNVSPPDVFLTARRALWERDLPLLQAMGANAVRVYNWDANAHVNDVAFLDRCAELGIYVILGVSNYYLDNLQYVPTLVRTANQHPALLMWAVSNEATADAATNRKIAALAAAVRQAEQAEQTWHPISIPIVCDLSLIGALATAGAEEHVDVHGLNCYWSATAPWPADFYAQLRNATSKPMLLTEWGIDTFHNVRDEADEAAAAAWLAAEWDQLISIRGSGGGSVGGVAFEWMDEPWKAAHAGGLGSPCAPDRGGLYKGIHLKPRRRSTRPSRLEPSRTLLGSLLEPSRTFLGALASGSTCRSNSAWQGRN